MESIDKRTTRFRVRKRDGSIEEAVVLSIDTRKEGCMILGLDSRHALVEAWMTGSYDESKIANLTRTEGLRSDPNINPTTLRYRSQYIVS